MSENFVKAGQLNDFPAESMKKVAVNGEYVLVINVGGKLYAIGNSCTHEDGPLDEGELEGNVVTCPWHGGRFDVTNGKVLAPPPKTDALRYDVKIQGNDVLVKKKNNSRNQYSTL